MRHFALRRSRRLVLAQFLIHELARRPAGATERWPGGFREYQRHLRDYRQPL